MLLKKIIPGLVLGALVLGGDITFSLDEEVHGTEMRTYTTDRSVEIELVHEGCRISLERRRVDSDVLTVRFRSVNSKMLLDHRTSECGRLSLKDQTEYLGKMVERLSFGQETPHPEWHLSAGLLNHTFPEMAKRLAKEAAEHPDWPEVRKRERRSPGAANGFLFTLGNEGNVFPEMKTALGKVGYQVELSGMEKVHIRPAKELEYYDWLAEQGIAPDMDVPFGAVTWFRLKYSPIKPDDDVLPVE